MHDVARTITASHGWSLAAVALIVGYVLVSAHQTFHHILGRDLRGFGQRMRQRAKLCLTRTGYVGALITRHTVLVTVNLLALNLSLNLLGTIKAMDDHSWAYAWLQASLYGLSGACVVLIIVIAAITFALCNEILRQAEADR